MGTAGAAEAQKEHKVSVGKRYSLWWEGEWDLIGSMGEREGCPRQGEQHEQEHGAKKSWHLHA